MPVATAPRLGFAGVGWIGRNRMNAIERTGAGRVAAIYDPAVDNAVASYRDLLELDLDGVVIATPSALHAEQAVAALERGLPVFVQKPVGCTAEEVRAVVAAAERADVLLGVDLSYRYAEAFRAARELVCSGRLGEVFAAELTFHNAFGPDKAWAQDPSLAGGGCVIDLGIHLVDLAVWTLDLTPRTVTSYLRGKPLETWATAELDHVRIACSWHLHAGADAVIEATFRGSDGAVAVSNVAGSFYDFRCVLLEGPSRMTLVEPPDEWPGRAAVDWSSRIATGERFDPLLAAQLVRTAEILDRVYGR
jgi:predicted dehydrogenase